MNQQRVKHLSWSRREPRLSDGVSASISIIASSPSAPKDAPPSGPPAVVAGICRCTLGPNPAHAASPCLDVSLPKEIHCIGV